MVEENYLFENNDECMYTGFLDLPQIAKDYSDPKTGRSSVAEFLLNGGTPPNISNTQPAKIEKTKHQDFRVNDVITPLPKLEKKYKSILQEAEDITDGSRKQQYAGDESFNKIASICKVLKIDVTTATGSCLYMMILKLVRESYKHKRDNLVDLCGYARLLSVLEGDENT